jgi:hypothetical protein
MAHVFTPQEMAQFKTLHDAGAILRMDRSYPGAAVQEHNLAQKGVLFAAEHAPEAGGVLGHIGGAAVGMGVKALANRYVGNAGLKAVEKRITKL